MDNDKCPRCGAQMKPRGEGLACGRCRYWQPTAAAVQRMADEQAKPKVEAEAAAITDPPTETVTSPPPPQRVYHHVFVSGGERGNGSLGNFIMDSMFGPGGVVSIESEPVKESAPPPSREERLAALGVALQERSEELDELRDEYDFMLHHHLNSHPYMQRRTKREYEPRIAEVAEIVEALETQYGIVRDELGESAEEAGKRDGYIAWLEDWWKKEDR